MEENEENIHVHVDNGAEKTKENYLLTGLYSWSW